jgi:hypothetical protein
MALIRVLHHAIRLWVPCTRTRRYHAALSVLVASHRFPQLESQAKARVNDELVKIFKPFGIYPWWRFRHDVPPTTMAADRAVAMYRLGIPTGVPELSWEQVLHPWHQQSPAQLLQDFNARHSATEEAVQFLAARGLPRAEIERFSTVGLLHASAKAANDG